MLDWDFGLIDREGNDKPALAAIASAQLGPAAISRASPSSSAPATDGHASAGALKAVAVDGGYETIVVDDGSEDGTADYVERKFPVGPRDLRLDPCGLSAARNAGAEAAHGRNPRLHR